MKKDNPKKILDAVNFPADVRKLKHADLPQLCQEVRSFLIESVSQSGGHFGSSLGVVELTVALHRVFDTPKDKLIWDVGHQSYPHKILTGRKERMHTIRKRAGLAPFPKREESEYDALSVGHASTSISAATGMAMANRDKQNAPQVIAVIGDGSLAGGMALEALNHAGDAKVDMLVILNDNKMSISPNVGGMRKYLTRLIASPSYVRLRRKGRKVLSGVPTIRELVRRAELHTKGMITPGTFFEELGFAYYGPIDGHDVETLVEVLDNLKKVQGPKFLHIITKKGKGYAPAEQDRLSFHAVSPFDPVTGQKNDKQKKALSYTDVFSAWICDKAATDEKLQAITPAMCDGSGLTNFKKSFPARYHDVGIAEQHAMTFAAGLACAGEKPVVAIYSSFLQRAYDQLIHDVAMQNLNVLIAIDRAGIVGPDGATHAGSFDLSFMRVIPNLVIMAPANKNECYAMLEAGFDYDGPVAVRYPRGGEVGEFDEGKMEKIIIGQAKLLRTGKQVAILVFGALVERAKLVAENLDATLVNMRCVKPLDEKMLTELAETHRYFITLEDNVVAGGAGSAVNEWVLNHKLDVQVKNIGLPDKNLEHGSREEVLTDAGLSGELIEEAVRQFVE
ncbi:MAG: 1-deoxy-D-xylulose-5-phosphate synthase [Parcubacteria group bacterium]|jgi:1-deoxy-D-xylulose-5-phosphate synthase